MKERSILELHTNIKGYTLVEMIIALAVIGMVSALAVSTLALFNQFDTEFLGRSSFDSQFRQVHLYLQRQIEKSEKIYIHSGVVYLQDMETPLSYYNHYDYNAAAGYVYRYKANAQNLTDIGQGEVSQLARQVKAFLLVAETNASGGYTGNIRLTIVFDDKKDGQTYESIIHYPKEVGDIQQR